MPHSHDHHIQQQMSSQPIGHVLLLGAGLVSGPCIKYWSEHNIKVTVASRSVDKKADTAVRMIVINMR